MKITTLIENKVEKNKDLISEHGLSFYIETEDMNILFDTGQSGNFIDNAEKLNINLNKINCMALSHAHYDHCGGVKRLLNKFNIKSNLYVSNNFFMHSDKYHYCDGSAKFDFSGGKNEYKYIGIDFDKDAIEEKGVKIKYIKNKVTEIANGVYVFTNFKNKNSFEKKNPNMKLKIKENYIIDEFDDEIALGLDTDKGLIILLGCSHPGILNIIESIVEFTGKKIYGVIGGTHLIEADNDRIKETIKRLNDMQIELIGVSHCTGENACNLFKKECGNFFENSTGTTIII